MVAVNPTTENQITRYLYEDMHNASLQTSAIYPDSNDLNSNGSDQVKTKYDLAGRVVETTDQNGTVREYHYDNQGRLVTDCVIKFGNVVDDKIRAISRSYNSFGALETLSSLKAGGVVSNEIKYEYDANRKLKKLFQSYDSEIVATTPFLEYTYDNANRGRLSGVIYPSGKIISYDYDKFDRVASINEAGKPIVSYIYEGSGTPMQTTYNESGLSLNYTNGGLDRFGWIVNHGWMKGNEAKVHILHGYDFAGNRTFRHDAVHAANSELYKYDQVNQVKSLDRGGLNEKLDAVAVANHTESWDFDKTGNWMTYAKNGATETRKHNKVNEIQDICEYDANGNMTLMPGLKGKYDAWNRLVEVRDSIGNQIATYEYNGANQRIKKTVGNIVTKSFFNEKWQELESQTGIDQMTYVWGLRYIDDLVYREKDAERLYSLTDPNWNIVALTDSTGTVVERMKYDAFGKITWLDRDFDLKNDSGFEWNRTFTGQVLDIETGLMLYRNRFYHPSLGIFVSRDPIKYYSFDVNLFRYIKNIPSLHTDSMGLKNEKTGVKYCKGYQKGAIFLGGIMPTHWFIMIDGIGIGKFEKDLHSIGIGEIRYDDHIIYPEVDPDHLEDGQFYSICENILLDSDCYDLIAFKNIVKNYGSLPAGIYIAGILDCKDWIFSAVCEGMKNSKSRDNTWWSFCKCSLIYADEDCSIIQTDQGIKLR